VTDQNQPFPAAPASSAVGASPRAPDLPPASASSKAGSSSQRHSLDPQYVPFQRAVGLIVTACASGTLLGTAAIVWATGEAPRWLNLLLAPAWFGATIAVAWFSYAWPPLEHRYTSYVLDDEGIEIRSGVVWRAVTSVPRSRVQHIDVSQGPLERAYGLGRLVIYTAGTEHSRVDLPGLNHDVAFELRNHLLPQGDDDAV
jgi:membrane protein YdbS with pleckstrin-like domain